MTKKHFIALADIIIRHNKYNHSGPFTEEQLVAIAGFCKDQNPQFNYERWIGYINGENGPGGGDVRK
jgi:hypothetical protein